MKDLVTLCIALAAVGLSLVVACSLDINQEKYRRNVERGVKDVVCAIGPKNTCFCVYEALPASGVTIDHTGKLCEKDEGVEK